MVPSTRPRPWQEILSATQDRVLALIAPMAIAGDLDRTRYLHWMAAESALCRIHAAALDGAGAWYDAQPHILGTLQQWAHDLRHDAQLAADDARALGGIAGPTPAEFAQWHAFVRHACGTLRVGEALGAVLLPTRALRGPAREAIARVVGLPMAAGAGRYLQRRLLPDSLAAHDARATVLELYAASSLAKGSQRAADWYLAALQGVLRPAPAAFGVDR